MESDRCRIIRGQTSIGPQADGSDHIRIHPVFHIRRFDLPAGFFCFLKPDNADPQGVYDIRIGLYPAPASAPGREPKVAVFQEQGKGRFWNATEGSLLRKAPPESWS